MMTDVTCVNTTTLSLSPVRLTPFEYTGLCNAFDQVLSPLGIANVYIFGSRARIDAKGGDIDLLIECHEKPDIPLTKLTRNLWLAIEDSLGEERRIDIVWDVPGQNNAFAQLVRQKGIIIWPAQNN